MEELDTDNTIFDLIFGEVEENEDLGIDYDYFDQLFEEVFLQEDN